MRITNSCPLELKRADPKAEGRFTGLASTFTKDRAGDTILKGAFQRSLDELNTAGAKLPLLWQHDAKEPIGSIMAAHETAEGLEVEGVIALEASNGRRAYSLLKTGGLSMSIGFQIPDGGAEMRDGERYIKEAELIEVSLVPLPMNVGAVVRDVKFYESRNEFQQDLHALLGLSNRAAKKAALAAWPAITGSDDDEPELSDDAAAALAGQLAAITKSLRYQP